MEGQTACCTAACYTAVLHCGISVASAAQFMSELGHEQTNRPCHSRVRFRFQSGLKVKVLLWPAYDPSATLAVHCGNGFDHPV
jgi:hypothetical protein